MTGAVDAKLPPALITALRADAAVAALVDVRVYGFPPKKPTFPYVTLGDPFSRPFDTSDSGGNEASATIHVWTKGLDMRSTSSAIQDAIRDAIHRKPEAVAIVGHAVILITAQNSTFRPEQEGGASAVGQAIMRFRIVTQAAA